MEEKSKKYDEVFGLKLNGLGDKIDNLAKSNKEKFDTIIDYNKKQDIKIKEINVILRGDGNPEVGHTTRLTRLEEKVKTLFERNKIQVAIMLVVLGAVVKLIFF